MAPQEENIYTGKSGPPPSTTPPKGNNLPIPSKEPPKRNYNRETDRYREKYLKPENGVPPNNDAALRRRYNPKGYPAANPIPSEEPPKSEYNLANLSAKKKCIWVRGVVKSKVGNNVHFTSDLECDELAAWCLTPDDHVGDKGHVLGEGDHVYYVAPTASSQQSAGYELRDYAASIKKVRIIGEVTKMGAEIHFDPVNQNEWPFYKARLDADECNGVNYTMGERVLIEMSFWRLKKYKGQRKFIDNDRVTLSKPPVRIEW